MRWYYPLIAALLAAFALQAGLLVMALYALVAVVWLSRYLSRTWISGIVAKRSIKISSSGDHEGLQIGEDITIQIELMNKGKLRIGWVLVEDLLPRSALVQRPPKLTVSRGRRIKLGSIAAGKKWDITYTVTFQARGYYQIGPSLLETGDYFGLHRRHRVVTKPIYVMVYPKVIPLPKYDFASQRPIGEVHLANRLFEDPTRNAGVRPYQLGDPLQRIHWRASARTGQLQSKVYDPTSLAGASLLLDFYHEGYHDRGEPVRSELAITTASSLAYLIASLNQQIGLMTNGQDAARRLKLNIQIQEGDENEAGSFSNRETARSECESTEGENQLQPLKVETRRGGSQFQLILEVLARVEFSMEFTFHQLVMEAIPHLPRDATVIAILPKVPVETALVLGMLRRQGFAVSALLIALDEEEYALGYGRLVAEGIRDVRAIDSLEQLANLGEKIAHSAGPNPLQIERALA